MSIKRNDTDEGFRHAPVRITSRQNPVVSETAKLMDKKYRDERGIFLLDGIKLTLEAVSSELTLEYILISERAEEKYCDMLDGVGAKIFILSSPAFERVTDERSPEGVVAAVRYSDGVRRDMTDGDAEDGAGGLILDGVQNPENLGAILRSARAFGIERVICGAGCADIYGRRVMRASMGAALHLGSLFTENTAAACRRLAENGHRVIAATPREGSSSLDGFVFRRGDCIVIGNEGHGISDEVMAEVTGRVHIPMAEGQESLNAAAAAAVIMWELYKGVKK